MLALHTAHAQIVIGQSVGVTGSAAATVKESMAGAALYINHINSFGGVEGQKIEIITLDDQFDTKLAVSNTRTLIEQKGVLAMFMSRGTPHTQAVFPILAEHGVVLLAPSTGAMVLHDPVNPYVFNVRAPYQRELHKQITHLNTLGITRIGVVHVDDSFGADALVGVMKGFEINQLKPLFIEKFNRTTPDFSAIAPKAKELKSQAILVIGTGSAVVKGIRAFREVGISGQMLTMSNNASGGFIKELGADARGVVVSQVLPSSRSTNYSVIKEARMIAHDAKTQPLTPAMMEGFISAKVLVEGLKRCAPKCDRKNFRTALEGMRKLDIGGLEISYSPTDHSGLDFADLSIVSQDGEFLR